jgi:hypothetical protein
MNQQTSDRGSGTPLGNAPGNTYTDAMRTHFQGFRIHDCITTFLADSALVVSVHLDRNLAPWLRSNKVFELTGREYLRILRKRLAVGGVYEARNQSHGGERELGLEISCWLHQEETPPWLQYLEDLSHDSTAIANYKQETGTDDRIDCFYASGDTFNIPMLKSTVGQFIRGSSRLRPGEQTRGTVNPQHTQGRISLC